VEFSAGHAVRSEHHVAGVPGDEGEGDEQPEESEV
jgi:hypothetical protein